MKIAILINTSWNIYNFRRGLIQKFQEHGNSVIAIAPEDPYSEKLVNLGCLFIPLDFAGTGMNPIKDFGLLLKMLTILRKERPDVLLTYTIKPNIYGSIVAGLLGIPCICNVSGLGTVFLWKGRLRKLATALYSVAFRFNRWVFFQNEEDREEFLEWVTLNRKKTSLLPGSGVNLDHFSMTPIIHGKTTIFLMISRLIIEKGVREYAEAARILKMSNVDAECWLLGAFDPSHARSIDQAELDKWIRDGIIKWIDHVEDTRPFIKKAEVVVLPSYREGTPKTLLEAGGMGKALIATDVPGCRQVVMDGKNGFLCKLKNGKDLAGKMKLYMSLSVEERTQMRLNARSWMEETFDEKLVIDLYVHKIEELTGK